MERRVPGRIFVYWIDSDTMGPVDIEIEAAHVAIRFDAGSLAIEPQSIELAAVRSEGFTHLIPGLDEYAGAFVDALLAGEEHLVDAIGTVLLKLMPPTPYVIAVYPDNTTSFVYVKQAMIDFTADDEQEERRTKTHVRAVALAWRKQLELLNIMRRPATDPERQAVAPYFPANFFAILDDTIDSMRGTLYST